MKVYNIEKFAVEQIIKPYQNKYPISINEINKLPYQYNGLRKLVIILNSDEQLKKMVFDRLFEIVYKQGGIEFSQYYENNIFINLVHKELEKRKKKVEERKDEKD